MKDKGPYRTPEEPPPKCDNPDGLGCDNPVEYHGVFEDGTEWHLCQECADDAFGEL